MAPTWSPFSIAPSYSSIDRIASRSTPSAPCFSKLLPDPQLLPQILHCKIIVRQRLELSFLPLGVLGLLL
ncbi:unnamed protein product [Chondrus crispus]|uniref:Uncharacterized protein n=1 Tax=Chondrus crispus TaxID=2769 RepID=R7Q6K1_CHOCR|nr:unnamed protein product [Chondrus crispus]CDF34172.1 unnamed protein product [Chondrus crispus]|eukprot:XP_005713991.1 unnamed protein product [Chondrus crispus]